MAVGRVAATRKDAIEHDELLGERVLVRRDVAAVDHERAVAVAARQVTEDLVVGAILLDDIDDVPNERRIPRQLGHGTRHDGRRASGGICLRRGRQRQLIGRENRGRVRGELLAPGNLDDAHRSAFSKYIPAAFARRPLGAPLARADAEQGADRQVAAVATDVEARRIPRCRNQAGERRFAGVARPDLVHGNGVDRAERDEQRPAIARQRERRRRGADAALAERRDADAAEDTVIVRVDNRHRVVVAVGDVEPRTRRVPRQRRRVAADRDRLRHSRGDDVDPYDTPRRRDAT